MRQIREGVLVAAQRSVERSDMGGAVRVFVKEGWMGGGHSRMARRSLQSAVRKQTRKTSSQLVLAQDRMAPAQRRRRHDAGQRHRSQMLSGGVR